jgi:hypothetical protein
MSGTYLGPVYPEPPPFKDPEEDLNEIGIDLQEVCRPTFERPRPEERM